MYSKKARSGLVNSVRRKSAGTRRNLESSVTPIRSTGDLIFFISKILLGVFFAQGIPYNKDVKGKRRTKK